MPLLILQTGNNHQFRLEETEDRIYFTNYHAAYDFYKATNANSFMLKNKEDIKELINALEKLL